MTEIKIDNNFEEQSHISSIDVDLTNDSMVKLVFNDGYFITVTNDKKQYIMKQNKTAVEVVTHLPNGNPRQYAWIGTKDEVQHVIYNWLLEVKKESKNKFRLHYKMVKPVGGGAL